MSIWNNIVRDVVARAPAVAGRHRSGVRARQRVDARRSADGPGQQVRLRPVAPGHRDPPGRDRSQPRDGGRSDLAAAADDAAVSVVRRQHGVRSARAPPARCSSRSAPTTSRSRRRGGSRAGSRMSRTSSRDSGRSPRSSRTAASMAAFTTASIRRRPADRPRDRRVRRRALHGASARIQQLRTM